MEPTSEIVPLLIDGEDIVLPDKSSHVRLDTGDVATVPTVFQGASPELSIRAAESCAKAFPGWSATPPSKRRELFWRLAQIVRERRDELQKLIEDEIHTSPFWANINIEDSIGLLEQAASLIASEALGGSIPVRDNSDNYALVFQQPLGVILGIAPWNAPLILGFRAVVAAVAVGNTAILKGSELSPRIHYLIASLFREAGFPPGVVNFILHDKTEAANVVNPLIEHPAVRKCNFTGSTPVGRIIAAQCAKALKPVLLELGGKNALIVLENADLKKAAEAAVIGGSLNNGQICMSTDLVLVHRSVVTEFQQLVREASQEVNLREKFRVITGASKERISHLLADAESKGATITPSPSTHVTSTDSATIPVTILENINPEHSFFSTESFGPLIGIVPVDSDDEAVKIVNGLDYGLSSSIFSRDHFRAMKLSEKLNVGAIHINSPTPHDEAFLPHGGVSNSGYGRFGSVWGLEEFVQTKTVTISQ